eukprot:COSAG06_NODE_30058_length_545_cov_1.383408_2_plen_42_part_01
MPKMIPMEATRSYRPGVSRGLLVLTYMRMLSQNLKKKLTLCA